MKFLRKIYKKNIGSTEMNTRKAPDKMGNGNEIRTSEAISFMIPDGVPIYGLIFGGKRYDIGDIWIYEGCCRFWV